MKASRTAAARLARRRCWSSAGSAGAIAGAGSGGVRETQEMLDFSARHRLTADVEILPQRQVNDALDRLARNDVRYRFVLDMTTTDD
jgi:alcohol dehydrogenase (NADP+)